MFLIYCPECDHYSATAAIGQRVKFEARLNAAGVFVPVYRNHLLDELHSEPERIWCPKCNGILASVAELEQCPCVGTSPDTFGQDWWRVRGKEAKCALCGVTIQGSVQIRWG